MNDTPTPQRSEEELLTLVRTKAAAIRHRRLQTLTGAVAGVVVVVGCLVVASRQGDDGATNVTMASPGSTISRMSGEAFSAAEPVPGVLPDTTTPVPGPAPAPVPAPVPSDAGPAGGKLPGPAHLYVPAPAGNQNSGAAGGPTPAPEPVPTCSPAEIAITAVTDRPTYATGSNIHVTVTARNQSSHPCARPTTFSYEFADGAGNPILNGAGHEDWFTTPPPPLQPGETVQHGTDWGGTICDDSCRPAPPGTYTVTATIGSYTAGPVTFTISG